MDLQTPLSAAEASDLVDFLNSEAVPDECMSFAMLDGFLTGVVIGPDVIMPSEWIPEVWGEAGEPEFDTLEQAEKIMGLMLRHMNSIALTFANDSRFLTPYLSRIDSGEALDEEVAQWCIGFVVAMDLRSDDWTRLIEGKEGLMLFPVLTLGTESGYDYILESNDPQAERQELTGLLVRSIQSLHVYWLSARASVGLGKRKADAQRSAAGKHVSGSSRKGDKRKRRK